MKRQKNSAEGSQQDVFQKDTGLEYVFILAGGSGTRLWPASTKKKPKQFLSFGGEKTLLRLTLERAFACNPASGVIIITIADQLQATLEDCADLSQEQLSRLTILPEPAARNTAPAIALGVSYTAAATPASPPAAGGSILVLPADHLITPLEHFLAEVSKAVDLTQAGYLVTFGIPPERPETGYGYIEAGGALARKALTRKALTRKALAKKAPAEKASAGKSLPGRRVASFREKPDRNTAEEFLSRGGFFWNSGMFCFTGASFMTALSEHRPDIAEVFHDFPPSPPQRQVSGITVACAPAESPEIEALYSRSPKDSIDYAVMEKSKTTAMVEASFSWSDIGSWDEAAKLFGEQPAAPRVISVDSDNVFVDSDLPVALAGVEDLVVVVKNGVVLVCKRGKSQKVKQVVETIQESGEEELL